MKTTGIIAEYNPFHKGHQYQIEETRRLTGCDYIIAVISGDFVQRGAPAVFPKHLRAQMALSCGADLVLEMPAPFAFGSAEDFASCGVALLSALGITDFLSFGSEEGDIDTLKNAALQLNRETEEMSLALKAAMKQGLSYPAARSQALALSSPLLSSPNNILGVEYIRAILKQESGLTPVTVKRLGSGYHEEHLNHTFASATAIRAGLAGFSQTESQAGYEHLSSFVPEPVFPLIQSGHPMYLNDFSPILNYVLLENAASLEALHGWSRELADRMRQHLLSFGNFEERIFQLKTKQYTYTRISRALMNAIFRITCEDMEHYRQLSYAPYARVLGFRKSSSPLLTAISRNSSIPLITKVGNGEALLTGDAKKLFQTDLAAAHLYNSVVSTKYHISVKNEYSQPVVIL